MSDPTEADFATIAADAKQRAFLLGEELINEARDRFPPERFGDGFLLSFTVYQGFAQLVAPWAAMFKTSELASERKLADAVAFVAQGGHREPAP